MTEQDFMQNIMAAQKLCSPDGDRLVESKKGDAPTSKASVYPENFGISDKEAEDWDRMFLSEAAYDNAAPTQTAKGRAKAPVMTQQSVNRSRVPDFIKKSMMSESIDTTALSDNPLDRMDLSRIQKQDATPRRQITEQVVSTPQQMPSSAPGIDYPLLRAIINECIDNKFKEYGLTKDSLNETSLKTIHLKAGNIKLVDNSGNIYSAQLEKRGNLNEGKK